MRPDAVRGLLDAYAGADAAPVAQAWVAWREAGQQLADARQRQGELERERERLQWQLAELDKLAPQDDEWPQLTADHQRLAHGQGIQEAVALALDALRDADVSADTLTSRAIDALERVLAHDPSLGAIVEVLQGAQAQLQDAAHSLQTAARGAELDPARLETLDARMSLWVSLARRWRRPPEDLYALGQGWRDELRTLDAATDLAALETRVQACAQALDAAAAVLSRQRKAAAPKLSTAITAAMQDLGMAGGRFEVALLPQSEVQSHGRESVEFLVAGHTGSTPRPLGKVASGGELSRISLAIAVSTSRLGSAGTLIFDEIDAGVGGAVAETVGRLMQQLGRDRQVLAVTHLPQVAACADQHFVVSKRALQGRTLSDVQTVAGEARISEIARMLGGQQLSGAGLAHAKEMLSRPAAGARAGQGRRLPGPKTKWNAMNAIEDSGHGLALDVVLVTGTSGSGKGVALNALEDAGYFCVDNLPPELLRECLHLEAERSIRRIAVAIDVRTASSLPTLAPLIDELRADGVSVRVVFLDASTDTLVRRFSETRRRHPLTLGFDAPPANGQEAPRALLESIAMERGLLEGLRDLATVIDTSHLKPAQLRAWIRQLVALETVKLTLVFESFAFKQGVPRDADYVFDVRMLPNPHYVRELRPQTGRDADVITFLRAQPEVLEMIDHIDAFLSRWLPSFELDQRSYLTVAIGCTGGQHRSVYIAEQLAERLRARTPALVRHRELDAREGVSGA